MADPRERNLYPAIAGLLALYLAVGGLFVGLLYFFSPRAFGLYTALFVFLVWAAIGAVHCGYLTIQYLSVRKHGNVMKASNRP